MCAPKNLVNCKECDGEECIRMVNLIKVFAEFMKEIQGDFGFLNFGGRSNEKMIGKKLLDDKVLSPEKIHSKGYHMSTLGTRRCPSWDYAMQQLDCTQFVTSMDQFLSLFFGLSSAIFLNLALEIQG